MSGLQSTPPRIPEQWDANWFRQFIRDVLAFSDVRNANGGAGITVTGTPNTPATISTNVLTIPVFTATTPGLAPASGGGTINFLRADGAFNSPPVFGASNAGYVPASGTPTGATLHDSGWNYLPVLGSVNPASQDANSFLAGPSVNGYAIVPIFSSVPLSTPFAAVGYSGGVWENNFYDGQIVTLRNVGSYQIPIQISNSAGSPGNLFGPDAALTGTTNNTYVIRPNESLDFCYKASNQCWYVKSLLPNATSVEYLPGSYTLTFGQQAKLLRFFLIGAGGSGGNGWYGTSGTAGGGGGGGSGAVTIVEIPAADITPGTLTLVVGSGGAAPGTAAGTSGNAGGDTYIQYTSNNGVASTVTLIKAGGGGGGTGGSNAAGGAGGTAGVGQIAGSVGGAGDNNGAGTGGGAGSIGTQFYARGSGGGGGGATLIGTLGTAGGAGGGSFPYITLASVAMAGGAGGAVNTAGGAGVYTWPPLIASTGGGGSGGSAAGSGLQKNGGTGFYGAGGGGGGGYVKAASPPKGLGAKGGDGYALIVTEA